MHDQSVGDVVEPGAAILLRQIGAEHPELRHLRDELFRKASFYVAVADDGHDLFIDEGANRVANGALLFGEGGVDVVEI